MRTIDLVVLGSYVQDHVFLTERAPGAHGEGHER